MRFVLVHGSWHDGSAWDAVSRHLVDDGHEVHTLTLPGNGDQQNPAVTMSETVNAVVDLIVDRDLTDVVLVGHSFGGAVIQLVALSVPERLASLVFHNAYVIEDGASVFSYVPESVAGAFQALASPDGTLSLPYEFFRDNLINDADEATAQAAFAAMSPEPLGRSSEPLDLGGFSELTIPKAYVYATDDRVFPAAEFTWHPGMSQRLGTFRLIELPGSHEILFSQPGALASALIDAGRA
jgi:pimeloyl-ACP methyl ester carboxylesterase